uniref:(northern house mosquito) hypothetical protein n=1 Tax=Culex pipiens TaxID=7175 RepID=A0A8D8IHT5_CULPI
MVVMGWCRLPCTHQHNRTRASEKFLPAGLCAASFGTVLFAPSPHTASFSSSTSVTPQKSPRKSPETPTISPPNPAPTDPHSHAPDAERYPGQPTRHLGHFNALLPMLLASLPYGTVES